MRTRTANWFLCKIRYEKTMEDGLQKKVTEQYVVDAVSFTEAEARIIEQMASYISGEFEVAEIDRCAFHEIFFSDDAMAEPMEQREQNGARSSSAESRQRSTEGQKWYKSKLQFITIDERTVKEKKTNVYYLVQAASFEGARKNIDEVMGGTMIDYVISSVSETSIMDVFEHE